MARTPVPSSRYIASLIEAVSYRHPEFDVTDFYKIEELDDILLIMRLNELFSQNDVQKILLLTEQIIRIKNEKDRLTEELKKYTRPFRPV